MKDFWIFLKEEFVANKRNVLNVLILGILILGIPLGLELAKRQQIISSRAAGETIEFIDSKCINTVDGQKVTTCDSVSVRLNPPPTVSNASFNLVSSVYAAEPKIGNDCSIDRKYVLQKQINTQGTATLVDTCTSGSSCQISTISNEIIAYCGKNLDDITEGWYCRADNKTIYRKLGYKNIEIDEKVCDTGHCSNY